MLELIVAMYTNQFSMIYAMALHMQTLLFWDAPKNDYVVLQSKITNVRTHKWFLILFGPSTFMALHFEFCGYKILYSIELFEYTNIEMLHQLML